MYVDFASSHNGSRECTKLHKALTPFIGCVSAFGLFLHFAHAYFIIGLQASGL
jgi:hypothetical protein